MHHDPSEVSATARAGIGARTWFIWVIVGELLFGALLAVIMWLAQGPPHSSQTPNTQQKLHAHFNYRNDPLLPAIITGSVAGNPPPER